MTPLTLTNGHIAALVCFVLTIVVEVKCQCGQLPDSWPSHDKNQKLFAPWTVTIYKENDGVRPNFTIAGVLVTPKIVMSSAFYFVSNDTVMKVPPSRFFQATVGEHQWGLNSNLSKKIGISHLTLHPKYSMGTFWSNTRNDQMLFHLTEAVNVSELVQPICLPSGESINQIVQPLGPNPLILTGWDRTIPDEIYLNLDIQTKAECEKQWKACQIDDVYENRFCATPSKENNLTAVIHRDVAAIREMTNNTFYLAGQMNQVFSKSHRCSYEDLYLFNQYEEYLYSWLGNTLRCGSENFACGNGDCIPLYKQCNRYKDCVGDEDEVPLFCEYLYKCPEGEFYCGASEDKNCIPDSKVNDGVKDCQNGEDEFEKRSSTAQIVLGSVLPVAAITIVGFIFFIEYRKYKTRLASSLEADQEGLIGSDVLNSVTNDYSGIIITSPWMAHPKLVCIGELGKGGFGKVYKAVDLNEVFRCEYAIKCVSIERTLEYQNIQPGSSSSSSTEASIRNALKNLQNEIQVLIDLRSHYVVGYQGSWAEATDSSRPILDNKRLQKYIQKLFQDESLSSAKHTSQIFIKMELCDFTLGEYLYLKPGSYIKQDQDIFCIANDIVSGLKYIHARGYTHRDLNPKNIFCKKEANNSMSTWKIGDFGLAVQIGTNPATVYQGVIGTRSYGSPEMIKGLPYNQTTDLYSLGLVFIEMVYQNGSTFDKKESFDQIRRLDDPATRLQYFVGENSVERFQEFLPIINELLDVDSNLRPSAEELQAWFESRK